MYNYPPKGNINAHNKQSGINSKDMLVKEMIDTRSHMIRLHLYRIFQDLSIEIK